MLPGKKYTPDDFLRIAWKRRWFIVIPLVVIASTTAVVSMFLPNRYRASTSILIVPQRVPENFVQSTVTADLGERLNIISQQILSRTRLERIIQEFNLYERERERLIMEDVIEQMRRDIIAQRRPGRARPRRRQLVQRRLRIAGRPNGHAGHRAPGVAVRAGEPRGPRAAGRPDQPVPAGSARGGAAAAARAGEEARRSSGSGTTASCRSGAVEPADDADARRSQLQTLVEIKQPRSRPAGGARADAGRDAAGAPRRSCTPPPAPGRQRAGSPATAAQQLEAARSELRGAASCGSSPSTRTSAAPSGSSPSSRRRPRPRRCSSRCRPTTPAPIVDPATEPRRRGSSRPDAQRDARSCAQRHRVGQARGGPAAGRDRRPHASRVQAGTGAASRS